MPRWYRIEFMAVWKNSEIMAMDPLSVITVFVSVDVDAVALVDILRGDRIKIK